MIFSTAAAFLAFIGRDICIYKQYEFWGPIYLVGAQKVKKSGSKTIFL